MLPENLEPEIEYDDFEKKILYEAIDEILEQNEKKHKIKSKKTKSKILKNGIKIRTVILLILTLLANTYAWFIYLTTVNSSIEMHINEWDFELSDGENQEFKFLVEEVYPGMEIAERSYTAKNKAGSMAADVTCEITSVKILGDEYVLGDTKPDGTSTYTSDDLLNMIRNDYPFKIKIFIGSTEYSSSTNKITMQSGDTTEIKFQIRWPYQVGNVVNGIADNDAWDTEWGRKAYNYLVTDPDPQKYSVHVSMTIKAIQHYDGSGDDGSVPIP